MSVNSFIKTLIELPVGVTIKVTKQGPMYIRIEVVYDPAHDGPLYSVSRAISIRGLQQMTVPSLLLEDLDRLINEVVLMGRS